MRHKRQYFLRGETGPAGVIDGLLECVQVWRFSAGGDVGANLGAALPGSFDEPGAFQFAVRALNGPRGDAQVSGKGADGGELGSCGKLAGGNVCRNLSADLLEGRHRGIEVDTEFQR